MTPPESAVTYWADPAAGPLIPHRGIPFGSSSVQHGTAVFEGIRCYATGGDPALFRLEEHLQRLLTSAQILGLRHDYGLARVRTAVLEATSAAGFANCYVRPGLFAPDPYLSIDLSSVPFRLGIEVWPVTAPPQSAQKSSAHVTVSPWRRPSPASFPSRAKAVGTYVTSALAKTAAAEKGFDDALQLDPESGRVAEATTSNVFFVQHGQLRTPWLCDSLLAGITRDTVLTLARQLNIPVWEGPVETAELESAEEVFLTGTASELVPVVALEDHPYPADKPVFAAISEAFRSAVTGRGFGHHGWLTSLAHTSAVSA